MKFGFIFMLLSAGFFSIQAADKSVTNWVRSADILYFKASRDRLEIRLDRKLDAELGLHIKRRYVGFDINHNFYVRLQADGSSIANRGTIL